MFEILAINGLTPLQAITIFGVTFFKFTTRGAFFLLLCLI